MENEYKEILDCFDNVTCLGIWYLDWDSYKNSNCLDKQERQIVQIFKITHKDSNYNSVLAFNGKEIRRYRITLPPISYPNDTMDELLRYIKYSYLLHTVSTPVQMLQDLISDGTLNVSNLNTIKLLDLYVKIYSLYYTPELQFIAMNWPTRTEEAGIEAIKHAREIDTYR